MDEEEAEIKATEETAGVGKDKDKPSEDTSSDINLQKFNGSKVDNEAEFQNDNDTVKESIDTSDMSQNQDKEHKVVPVIDDPQYDSEACNQNLQNGDKEATESKSEASKDADKIPDKEIDTNVDISKNTPEETDDLLENVSAEKIEQIEDVSGSKTNSPVSSSRNTIKSDDGDSGTKTGDNGPGINENFHNIDNRVLLKKVDMNQDEHLPSESPIDTSVNSPRTPLSGVASDQGGSFDAYSDEEDNSLIAQQIVNQVIDKAIDTVNNHDGTAASNLDQSEEHHHHGSVEGEDLSTDDFDQDKQIVAENEDVPANGKSTDDADDDPLSEELTNIFLQRGRGNGEESDGDDSQQQVVQADDADGSRISLQVQHDDENDTFKHLQKDPTNHFEGVEYFQQEATVNIEKISEENYRNELSAQGETEPNAMSSTPGDPQIAVMVGTEGNSLIQDKVAQEEIHADNATSPRLIVHPIADTGTNDLADDDVPEDEQSEEEDVNFVVDETAHPGFPLVYGNYKACREVSPGVKECLIFETGEINKENKKSRIRSDSSSTASPIKPDSDPRIPNSPRWQEDKKVFKINKDVLNEGRISIQQDGPNEFAHPASEPTDREDPIPSDNQEHDEELVSDSQMLTHETFSLSPKPARNVPSFNIDNYNHIRRDLFTRSGKEDQEDFVPEHENKENIPESRSKKKFRHSPLGRPPVGHVGYQEDGSRYSEYSTDMVASPPSSGPIPGFNTMQEQQVNWLRMFKVLEDQHRTELKAQYAKHSQMIEQMQNTMETELKKQQNNIQRRLEAHRDALTETTQDESSSLSVYGYYTNDPGNLRRSPKRRSPRSGSDVYLSAARSPHADGYHSDSSDIDPLEIRRRMYTTGSSRAPAGIPGLADISDYSTLPSDSFHVKKKLEYDSTQTSILQSEVQRSPRSLLERPRSADGGERLLRGGVYSTPMPMSKGRSPQTVYDTRVLNDTAYRASSGTKPSKSTELLFQGHCDIGTELNEESLSPSSNVKLREKHAKHVADLKAYYEEEIQALRTALSSSHSTKETPNERILKEDNQDLRRRCEDLTDELDDANNCIRDLEQKIQGLEIRANDYSDRYKDSQLTVLTLKTRLEELHSYAKERDHMLDSLEQKVKHQAIALQDSYKIQDELQQTSKHDQMSLQRTFSKYEDLDKEYRLLKESFISKERSLYDARAEISDLNKTISRLELKNKQLMRENDNLLHKSAIAMNMSSAKTSYEESYSIPDQSSEPVPSFMSNHYDKSTVSKHHDNYQDSNHYNEYNLKVDLSDKPKNTRVSPLIKAEQELIKLQTNTNLSDNLDFKTQKKFYGSDNNYPPCNRDIASGSRIDIKAPAKNGEVSPRTRSTWNKGQAKRSNLKTAVREMTPTRFDVSVKEVGVNGKEKKKVIQIQEKNRTRSPRSGSNSWASVRTGGDEVSRKLNGVDETLDKIRQGEVINNWKGDNSSQISCTSTGTKTDSIPVQAMTREERIKERLQMIQQQEKRYDELTIEKRQLESALNRIPIHGRIGRKSISEKDDLEKNLEKVEHELGSVRMSLRKYQVLKSSR